MLDARVGLDVRVDRQLALAPMLGADVGMFFWNREGALTDPRVNTFIYAGIQGRIDLGESSSSASLLAIR